MTRKQVDQLLKASKTFQARIKKLAQACANSPSSGTKTAHISIAAPAPFQGSIGNTTLKVRYKCTKGAAKCCIHWAVTIKDRYDFDIKAIPGLGPRKPKAEGKTWLVRAAQVAGRCGWKEFDIKGAGFGTTCATPQKRSPPPSTPSTSGAPQPRITFPLRYSDLNKPRP